MPKIYSEDLRQKVMEFYKKSNHKSNTCTTFNIARTTLDDWILLEQQTGQLAQPKLVNVGRPSSIKDWQAFKVFVENTKFSQAKNLVALFEIQLGYPITYDVILAALHKLGCTHKKRVSSTDKPAK